LIPRTARWSATTARTRSSARRRRSSTPSLPTSRTATSAASRCSSARRRSRNRSCSPEQLQRAKLPHRVLNAKQHAKRGRDRRAGRRPKVITIATNMAGRGTDIVLGGNVDKQIDLLRADASVPEEDKQARIDTLRNEWQSLHDQVIAAGRTDIVGPERHESRRIDNQLRGPLGRQGDPGSSRFYLSMEDPLLKIFAGDRLKAIMDRLKLPEGEPTRPDGVALDRVGAGKVEARNFDIRKSCSNYDDVATTSARSSTPPQRAARVRRRFRARRRTAPAGCSPTCSARRPGRLGRGAMEPRSARERARERVASCPCRCDACCREERAPHDDDCSRRC